MSTRHLPVLLTESVNALKAERGGVFVDATLGGGGHTEKILQAHPDNVVIGIDRDAQAISRTKKRLAEYGDRVTYVHAPFSSIESVVNEYANGQVDGILADLGVSSDQIEDRERGFSFMQDGPLDMRMDATMQKSSAASLLAEASEDEIEGWLREYGEERFARKIANAIVKQRRFGQLLRTTQLADLVERTVSRGMGGHHPATRTFQAIRIAVNRELDEASMLLECAPRLLAVGGRLAVISFHSLEDRLVKNSFRNEARSVDFANVYKKGILPGVDEVRSNSRSRSARLRVLSREEI
ncbi:MAG: 16S rRNA (cytosine(1402)-N(4))-methyltransferase RsmH [Planctomycetes bacterium]|nr:16S rRNA (cytosine(1402)-N(4))-methyltransferase RsmH [Planctomycetota bacterium]